MALTFEQGPLATTMGQIAKRAGVERVTLYRHFGDERSLQRAAAQYCFARFPPPRPDGLAKLTDPFERATKALDELYAHWELMAPLVRPILRDADVAPERISLQTRDRYVEALRAAALGAFPARARRRPQLREAIRHAFDFRTWDSLERGGFSRRRAVGLMVRLVKATAKA